MHYKESKRVCHLEFFTLPSLLSSLLSPLSSTLLFLSLIPTLFIVRSAPHSGKNESNIKQVLVSSWKPFRTLQHSAHRQDRGCSTFFFLMINVVSHCGLKLNCLHSEGNSTPTHCSKTDYIVSIAKTDNSWGRDLAW